MAGVSAVGVHPTHRRQGLLSRLMAAMHEDARQRGEAIAGLEASESIIYGRFGYGLAANLAEYAIDSRASAFAVPAPPLGLALVDKDEATKLLPELFDRQRRTRAGEVDRSPAYWNQLLADLPHHREGGSARFHAVADDGYVLYRSGPEANVFQGERVRITVEELRGTTPEVEAALWRFVLDLDLVGQVNVKRSPVDEPIRWRLADPRQLRTVAVEDRLYVRILDTAAAFEARGYQGEGRLVLDVLPRRRPGESPTPRRDAGCSRPAPTERRAAGPGARTPISDSASPPSARCTWAVSRPHSWPPVAASRNCGPAAWPWPTPCSPPGRPRGAAPGSERAGPGGPY